MHDPQAKLKTWLSCLYNMTPAFVTMGVEVIEAGYVAALLVESMKLTRVIGRS